MAFCSPLVHHWYLVLLSNTCVFVFEMQEIWPNYIYIPVSCLPDRSRSLLVKLLKSQSVCGGGVDEYIQMYTTFYNTHTHRIYTHTLLQPWGAMVTLEL